MNKKILMLAGVLALFSGEVMAGCTTYTWNGVKTRYTCTYKDGHYYTYYYNSQGQTTSYVYYDTTKTLTQKHEYSYDEDGTQTILQYNSQESIASNTVDKKTESRYNESGKTTSYTEWNSPEAVANDTPDKKTEYTYDGNGYRTSSTYYETAEAVANNAPDKKSESIYDENGKQTSYTYYDSAESVASNTPDSKSEYTYDGNGKQTSEAYYNSAEAIATNTPDYKSERGYDENGYTTSYKSEYYDYDSLEARENHTPSYKYETYSTYGEGWNKLTELTVQYNSAEAIANNTPDYKYLSQKTDEGYVQVEYNNSDSVKNNTPDYYIFSDHYSMGGIVYDKNGKFNGVKDGYFLDVYNTITYDDENRIISTQNSRNSQTVTFAYNDDGTITVTVQDSDYTFDSAEEAYEYIFGFVPVINLAESEYANWEIPSGFSLPSSSSSSSSGLDRQRGRLIYTVREANEVAKEGSVNKFRLRYR